MSKRRPNPINLRDIEPRELQRGMALVTPGSFRTTKHAVTTVRNHGTSPVLGKRIKLRFHLGTIAAVADAHSLTEKAIEPGESGLVALSFHYPQIFCVGDSCILRTLSPAETIGGGRVLSLRDQRVTTQGPAFCQRLTEAAAAVEAGEFVRALCYGNEQPIVELKQAILSTELDETEVKQSIAALIKEQILAEIGDDSWLVVPRVNEFRDVLKRQLRGYHKANPLSLGMQQSYVCDLLRIPKSGFVGLWKHLKGESDLQLRNN